MAETTAATATAVATSIAASHRLAEESLPKRRYSQRQLLLERNGVGGDGGMGREVAVPHRPENGSSLSSSAHDSPLSPRLRRTSLRRARAASTESSASRGTDASGMVRPGRRTSAILNYADMMLMNAFLPAPNSAVERVQKLQRKARKYADFTAEEDRRMRIRNANPFRTMAEQRWKETQRLRERRIKEAAKASADSREKRGQRRLGAGFSLGPRKERTAPPIELPHHRASHLHAGLYCTVSPLSSAFSEGYGGGRSFRRAPELYAEEPSFSRYLDAPCPRPKELLKEIDPTTIPSNLFSRANRGQRRKNKR